MQNERKVMQNERKVMQNRRKVITKSVESNAKTTE